MQRWRPGRLLVGMGRDELELERRALGHFSFMA
jgi:hypothetical protein